MWCTAQSLAEGLRILELTRYPSLFKKYSQVLSIRNGYFAVVETGG
jgi:regulatory protein YycI of two-component signal transduction system YycFG